MQVPRSQFYTSVHVQVDLMMSGKHPVDAVCYIRDLGLFYTVFEFPKKLDPPVLDKHDWYVLALICKYSNVLTICNYVSQHLHFTLLYFCSFTM
jgi:hypothetical protein